MIITRFAPSPTGYLHIGSIRIALYSWIFSLSNNGKFLLRIENTDKIKSKNKFIKHIINDIKWLGINWNDEILIQSDRIDNYNKIINDLLISKKVYPCFCSKKRINELRKNQFNNKINFKYDNYCRYKNFSTKDLKNKHVIRFKNSINSYTYFDDWIHGRIKINNNELDDFIIRKENGLPTYNFCVVLDDLYMKITHIIRGSDHISNTTKQINILKTLNEKIPEYIHIPIILNENKNKLSKTNNFINLKYFKYNGYLPDAILHYLITLGSSIFDDKIKNILSKKEYIKNFSIKKINKSSVIFDKKKILKINKNYLLKLSKNKIFKYIKIYIKYKKSSYKLSNNLLKKIIFFYKERSYTLKDLLKNSEYLYKNINIENNLLVNFKKEKIYLFLIKNIILNIKKIEKWNILYINKILNEIIINNDFIKNNFYKLIRILLSGKNNTPKISILIYLLGKNKFYKRLNYYINN